MADGEKIVVRWLGRIGFEEGLRLQEEIVVDHAARGDTLLLLEHDPVYTTGRGGREENLPRSAAGIGVHRIGRGGDATYHGPGQLVGYALVDLRARGGDVHRFLRDLEEGVIDVLGAFGLRGERVPGRTGVWLRGATSGTPQGHGEDPAASPAGGDASPRAGVGPRKIASIGIGVRRGVTMHGFALNVSLDLGAFAAIVPCGIDGVAMTSMAAEGLDPLPSLEAVAGCAALRVPAALARSAAAGSRPGAAR